MIEVTLYRPDGEEQSYDLEKDSVMIGRAAGNDICLEVEGISRYHARLLLEGDDLLVEDLGSTNGTFVNSEKVEKTEISPSDKVSIGEVLLVARIVADAEDEPVQEAVDDEPSTMARSSVSLEELAASSPEAALEPETEKKEPTEVSLEKPEPEEEEPRDERIAEGDEFYWKSLESFLGPVWEFIVDESVTEIMINGPEEIYIERKGKLERTDIDFGEEYLDAAVLNIAQYVGRRVSTQEPYLDARLPDGSRVAVLMQPCSRKGTAIAIRKFSKEGLTLEKLIGFGSLTPEMETFISAAVALKKNIIISGGTSSGKTSLLNVVSGLIPDDERILTIEDSAELQLSQDHVLPMETKPPDKKGRGQVTIRDLVKVSLRMRPDRVIVGEIRGGEAIDLLQAMNTGHSGSMATIHASSPRQCLSRMETLSLFSGLDIPISALREQVSSAVELVIQAARLPDHSRKVTHISEVLDLDSAGSYIVKDIFRFETSEVKPDGTIIGQHVLAGHVPTFFDSIKLAGLTEAAALFEEHGRK